MKPRNGHVCIRCLYIAWYICVRSIYRVYAYSLRSNLTIDEFKNIRGLQRAEYIRVHSCRWSCVVNSQHVNATPTIISCDRVANRNTPKSPVLQKKKIAHQMGMRLWKTRWKLVATTHHKPIDSRNCDGKEMFFAKINQQRQQHATHETKNQQNCFLFFRSRFEILRN